jgi:hypothetical protein
MSGRDADAESVLKAVHQKWLEIIEQIGRKRLTRQYRRSLGMPVID